MRRIRRPPRPPPARSSRALPALLLLLMPLVFWWGRNSAEQPELPVPQPVACPEPVVATSTAGLCPCPAPKKPRAKKVEVLPIGKKQTPPSETARLERDPTEATAKYLRAHVSELSACAPKTGARLRVHLEVQVSPEGAIEKVRITNLEPLPHEIASCVDRTVRALSPPGFDGTSSEVFALTVVL